MFEYFRNVRIRTVSLVLIFGLIASGVIIGVASISTLGQVHNVATTWDEYSNNAVKKTGYLSDLRDALGFGGLIQYFEEAILQGNSALLANAQQRAGEASQAIADYRSIGADADEVAALAVIENTIAQYVALMPRVGELINQGVPAETIAAQAHVDPAAAVTSIDALRTIVRGLRLTYGDHVHEAQAAAATGIYVTLSVVAALVILMIVTLLWFFRSRLVGPIYTLVEFVGRIGRGDLSTQLPIRARDEVGSLGEQINQMVANLKDITLQTRSAVANLNSASAETLASTKQQAASVEQQFAAIQETTATLDEISEAGLQIATRAKDIANQAGQAADRSKDGLKSVEDMAQVMDAIEEQTEAVADQIVALSEKTQAIGDIIATVNDIAERSQLLALNAAIEASSAGEDGRRFTVVADEMKALADQAKQATGQVSSLLGEIQKGINSSVMSTEESVKRVANGREQSGNTQRTITELAETIDIAARAFDQIVASTNQQRVGLEQVAKALVQIRGGSEQTAAGTKQIEQAVVNINALGTQLDHTMERYAV